MYISRLSTTLLCGLLLWLGVLIPTAQAVTDGKWYKFTASGVCLRNEPQGYCISNISANTTVYIKRHSPSGQWVLVYSPSVKNCGWIFNDPSRFQSTPFSTTVLCLGQRPCPRAGGRIVR